MVDILSRRFPIAAKVRKAYFGGRIAFDDLAGKQCGRGTGVVPDLLNAGRGGIAQCLGISPVEAQDRPGVSLAGLFDDLARIFMDQLLQRSSNENEICEVLEQYLGRGDEFERSITFTEELILSRKFEASGTWLPSGRPQEKAFLYDIVANENDFCDVDTIDYLIRDSPSAWIPIPFNRRSIGRLMLNARMSPDPDRGFSRTLC
ncbi:unnamed protein product [Haemonchus placei]|uniref:Cytochrome P450 n=1 Tax=Haemonchus placei TaxID=6290 RepID=A0A0N4WHH8_HAEPC|nr:unnamed protein product [Haemonchus placei]